MSHPENETIASLTKQLEIRDKRIEALKRMVEKQAFEIKALKSKANPSS